MDQKYIPQQFEEKWKNQWEKEKTYKTKVKGNEKKMYVLDMFPYPSGAGLHVGHPRGFVGSDIIARYFRMKGYNVLHPMGWDAFGLPAENAAIKAKRNPADIIKENIANFTRQLKMLGFSYDWDKELSTTDPQYYKWTQWLFIQLFKMGLLDKQMIPVYYCPFCKTGLAQEEVLPNNTHERCNNPIEMKNLPQWIFRITKYADRLVSELEGLEWPQGILDMQRNWIGRKEGVEITYNIKNTDETITCFTTRPDTNFGATFVVLAPDHPFVGKIISGDLPSLADNMEEIEQYAITAQAKTEEERIAEGRKKTGVFTGYYAINHLTGREMPVWISDFVLSGFGTGAVVGVPGHDLRDFEFATAMKLDIVRVVKGSNADTSEITRPEQVQEEAGTMINSDFLNGLDIHTATEKMMNYMEEKGWGKRLKTYHLRDWIFSRQRYWGEPIPMVYCQTCADKKISYWQTADGEAFIKLYKNVSNADKLIQKNLMGWFPIDQKNLPLELPYLKSYEPNETGESPLAKVSEWVNTTCPHCGSPAKRETDTMPNWAGSCWYFMAFAFWNETKSDDMTTPSREAWPKQAIEQWLPVDWYVGGAEHAVLHLLYSRFWVKALQDLGLVHFNEPFQHLRNQGLILAADHRKMSKSWGNVINPDDVVTEYGADALRVYEMFMAPFNQEIPWSTTSLQGSYRFLKRIWDLVHKPTHFAQTSMEEDRSLVIKLHKVIAKVSSDIADVKYNTAVAAMMEFLNAWESATKGTAKTLTKDHVKQFLQILAPFAPFMTEELWRIVLGEKESIHLSNWPEADKQALVDAEVTIPVQVNGKTRGIIRIAASEATEETVVNKALSDEKIKKYVTSTDYKVIYVKGKILNILVTS